MKQFGSGIIGCVICVLALMGSILGGFVLDVDKDTRETTNYNYTTDITGLFDTDETPKYIDYSPSTNFIGYPEQTVEYVDSTVPNNYRYVADSGLTAAVSYDQYIYDSNIAALDGGNTHTPYTFNYTGTRYNLGTAVTSGNTTYNIIANERNGAPCITMFNTMMSEKGLTYGEYNLTNPTGYPIIIYNGSFTSKTLSLYDPFYVTTTKTATINDNCFPTKIVYSSSTLTAYNGSTQLWSAAPSTVFVMYDYGIMSGGTYTPVNVNTNFSNILNGTFTKNDLSITSTWLNATRSTFTTYSNLYIFYPGTEYDFGEERRFNSNYGSRYQATLIKDSTNTYFCASPVQTILYAIMGTTSIPAMTYTINVQNNGNPFFITNSATAYHDGTTAANLSATDNDIPDTIEIRYYDLSNSYITTYKNGTKIKDGVNSEYLCILWGYVPNNQSVPNVNTTFSMRAGPEGNIGSGDSYTFPNYSSVPNEPLRVFMGFNYTGTRYNFGTSVTDHNLTYNGYIPTYMLHHSNNTTSGPYISAYSLTSLLNEINVPNSTVADIEITYGSNNTSPMFFMHNQSWTQTTWSLNNSIIKGYVTTFNDSNFPTRFTWNAQTNWVTMYDGDTILYSDDASNIAVVTAVEHMNGGVSMMTLHVQGLIQRTGESINIGTINNSSTFDYSTRNFTPINTNVDSYSDRYSIGAHFKYIGSAYDNMGSPRAGTGMTSRLSNTTTTDNKTVPYVTTLDKIITGDYSAYSKVTINIAQGTHPILFYTGGWSYTYGEDTIYDYEHGYNVTYHTHSYSATIGDNAIATKIEYTPATEICVLYRNNSVTYTGTLSDITVIFKYDVSINNMWTEVTDQSATLSGVGMPLPVYAYMDPTKGIILNMSSATWENGYDNNDIYITMVRERAGIINELSIIADTSSITVRTVGNTMTAYITKYDGTTDTKTIGTWAACQVHINASEGTVSLTPLQGPVSYTNNVPENATTTTWTGWYNGGDITELIIATTQQSMRFSITNTSVFLNTYGVVMQDPSINVSSYFPEYEEWRLNFYSFALVGDSMTVNGQTFNVDEDQKITVTGEDGKTITGTLSNIYVTEKDDHTYFTFADGKDTVDLGETTSSTVSFAGRWYFTTGLYEGVDGVEEYYDWNLDGKFHATMAQTCLIFLGLLVFGVIIGKVTLGLTLKSIDGIILISVTVIALIIAGGAI